ncbi:Transient receptor putative cation channel sub M member 2 [Saguinus oedipus]|uniref:Transient receptor putative cation channel sub M member 2 n=1 Tax=Saguinus oedipus TaxID=9490 RepID=A0ABQ9TY89_SAGOE|nr:Transient receptor putative cation channel sub M member 2 [Saguinus oedipus]
MWPQDLCPAPVGTSFLGLSRKYVRVSQDTPSSVIFHLMTQHWGLDVPNLLISVTGGAKNFNMKPRLKSIFRRGLVKVAQTTGTSKAGGTRGPSG